VIQRPAWERGSAGAGAGAGAAAADAGARQATSAHQIARRRIATFTDSDPNR
jgi:hypothetical protein